MSNLKKQDQELSQARTVKEALQVGFVRERFVKNYEAITGRKDGDNRFQAEVFHYLELINDNPKLKDADRFSHFAAIVKAGTTGLSFGKEGQLYPILYGNIVKVQIGAHGKRELLRRMPNVKMILEGQVVLKGDDFKHDKLNNKVIEHITSEKDVAATLDNIKAAYCRIIWKDNTFTDVVVYHDELVKAKSKSKMQSDQSAWGQWPGQMCIKVAYNRAYKLYYSAPQTEVGDLKGYEVDEDEDLTPETHQGPTSTISDAEVVHDTDGLTDNIKQQVKSASKDELDEFLNSK